MTANGLLQLALYFAVLTALAVPLGRYMAAVYEGRAGLAQRVLGPLERLLYRLAGVRPDDDMSWKRYAAAVLVFNVLGILVVYVLQRLQGVLPLNPAGLPAVDPDVAFNTAVSFATNTNWQAYGGETTMSHLTQMLGLTVQNFVSAATGMAVLVALIRGFTRRQADGDRQLLGRPRPHDALRPAAALARPRARPRLAGRAADLRGEGDGAAARADDRRGRRAGDAAGDRARAGRVADRDQAARHERRRLLQRELGPPAREPDAALELRRGARDPADPRGALLHASARW